MKWSLTKTIRGSVWVKSMRLRVIVAGFAMIVLTAGTLSLVGGARAAQPAAAQSTAGGPAVGSAATRAVAREAARQAQASSAAPGEKYEGMITDTRCAARHSAAIGLSAADCTRACVHGGEQFALVDGENVYVLEGEAATLKKMAGQRAQIAGTLNGNKIFVSAVVAGQ